MMGISYGDGRWFDNEYEAVADSHKLIQSPNYDPKTDVYQISPNDYYAGLPGKLNKESLDFNLQGEVEDRRNEYPFYAEGMSDVLQRATDKQKGNVLGYKTHLEEPKDIHIIRHGTTEENEEDKIRGTNDDVKLSAEGRKHALEAAEELRGKGLEALVSSPLARAKETSQIIGKELGIPITISDKLKTWNVGNFEGKPCEGNNDILQNYAEKKPDEVVPGGESYNQFKDRAFEGIREAILANKDKKLGIVTHHMVESSLEGWEKTGQDNPSLDLSKLFEDTDQPGSVRKMTMEPDSTIMSDPFEQAARRQREAVKPGVTGHLSYTERTGKDISNYRGSRQEGMATRAGEAIGTSPVRTIGEPLLRGAQNLMGALKMISDRGHEGALTDEEIETIAPKLFDFTSMLNTPARPIPNTLGMFVAPSLGKKLYAQGLLKQGLSPGEVKVLTGVEHGADGMLRQEVSDLPSSVNLNAFKNKSSWNIAKLGDVLDNPEFYKVYPEAKNIKVERNLVSDTTEARFMSGQNTIKLNKNLIDATEVHDAILHELQHWVQNKEGFAFNVPSDAPASFVKAFAARMRKEGVTESPKERIYRQLASEVEARNTQKRAGMSELERRVSLATKTEDIPRSYQLIFDEKGNKIDTSPAMASIGSRHGEFTKMLDSGKSVEEIADYFGLGVGTVRNYKSQLRPNEMRTMTKNAREAAERLSKLK